MKTTDKSNTAAASKNSQETKDGTLSWARKSDIWPPMLCYSIQLRSQLTADFVTLTSNRGGAQRRIPKFCPFLHSQRLPTLSEAPHTVSFSLHLQPFTGLSAPSHPSPPQLSTTASCHFSLRQRSPLLCLLCHTQFWATSWGQFLLSYRTKFWVGLIIGHLCLLPTCALNEWECQLSDISTRWFYKKKKCPLYRKICTSHI